MRKYNYIFLFLLLLFAGVTFYFFPVKINKNIPVKSSEKLTPADRMDLAIKQEILMTKDPATGTVPKERLLEAAKQRNRMLRKSMNAIPGITWEERGPNNFPGRTRAIMIDPNDPTNKTIWVASVSGGLWKTTDITADPPGWQNVNDFFNNLAIVSLAYDPTNTNIMYFGTGEIISHGLISDSFNGVKGLGIWKTTDGGSTWNYLTSTSGTEFNYCQRILVTNLGTVLVATGSGGVQRSTDGGNTWTKVLGTGLGITGANSDLAYDLERTTIPANQYTRIFASLKGSIHLSTDDGVTFSDSLPTGVTADRIELAVTTDAYTKFVIALFEKDKRAVAIKNSFDAGSTWNDIPLPTIQPISADNDSVFTRKQGDYNLTIDVDPNNHNNYYVGGIYLHRGYYNSIYNYYAWEQLTNVTTMHADQHIMIHESGNSNLFYIGNDGGIYQGTLHPDGSHTFISKGEGYNTTQFYSCALHPDANTDYFLGGTQDNGSLQFSNPGINAAVKVSPGDGGFCHIDQNEPQFQFTSYIGNKFYYRSTNGGQSFVQFGNHPTSIGGLFIAPSDYDDVNNIMYQSTYIGYYERWDDPTTAPGPYTHAKDIYIGGQSIISAIKVSPNTPTTVYFGFVNGYFIRMENANTDDNRIGTYLLDGNSPTPAAYISCVEVEKGNENHIIITFSNYGVNSIWETLDGGTTWNSVEGNLPDIPVRWVIFNPLDADQAFIATELGVWSTDNLDGENTVWETTNSGLANIRVNMLQTRTSDNLILAATYGRGMFTAHVGPVAFFHSDKQEVYPNEPISFIDSSFYATSWLWDFGDGTTSIEQNPVHAYTTWGTYTVTLSVNNGYNTEVKTNYIKIKKVLGTPYQLTDGGNFEVNPEDFKVVTLSGTSWERGNSEIPGKDGTNSPSNAWVTGITEDNYSNNSMSYLYTPEFNFSAAGHYLIGFYAKYSLAVNSDAMDGFFVEYSIDSNKTWQPIFGERGFPYWPESGIFTGQSPDTNSNGFNLYYKDISGLAGNSVVGFRFTFYSDDYSTDVGAAIDDFQIVGETNPVLPVELTSFTGTSQKNGVLLNWTTATEVNNYGFEIERSSSPLGTILNNDSPSRAETREWEKIGFVEGHGNSYSPKDYSFVDSSVPPNVGLVRYKLKQIDINGQFEYSDIVEVNLSGATTFKLSQNYPNPFNPSTKIEFSLPQKAQVKLVIYNSLGEEVVTLLNKEMNAGYHSVKFDASNLTSGIYLYRISASETSTGSAQSFVDVKKMLLLK